MDTWVQRSADDFARAIEIELPQGEAWPRDPAGDLMLWVEGCAQVWGGVEQRSTDLLLVESDPRNTFELLPDWERAFGLPDACVNEPQTIEERRDALVAKITLLGGQSRAFFIAAAAALGYTISIYEYAPYTCGISACGETRPDGGLIFAYAYCGTMECGVDPILTITANGGDEWYWQCGAPELRYYWVVKVLGTRLTWFRGGTGECGQDHHCEFATALDLECLIRRWAPAHTQVIFDYAQVDFGNTGAGTGSVPDGYDLDFDNPGQSGLLMLL